MHQGVWGLRTQKTQVHAITKGLSGPGRGLPILTTFDADYVYQALQAGASGFLVKDTEPAERVQAVRIVARGDALLSSSAARRLIADIAGRPRQGAARPDLLTRLIEREREVLTPAGTGLSNDEIAGRLFLQPVDREDPHQPDDDQSGRSDRAQLVVLAYESGLPARPHRNVGQ